MGKQTITAFYDSREYANNAALMLRQVGIQTSDVTISPEAAATGHVETAEPLAKGFWASLENLFGGTDDHSTYAEGLRRGGIMLTAHVDDAKVDDAVRIVEQHGSVDLNERETTWRGEGWTGSSSITGGGVANKGAGPLRSLTPVVETKTDMAATRAINAGPVVAAAPVAAVGNAPTNGRDDVIQVFEETLNVGKRAVNRGKVRIHSYVVETPITETVSLRDETVTVDRRPIDRPLAAADLGVDAFQNRTIEMEEIDEEAVIAKSVRVVEEIGIRKDVYDRTQVITDTVRSTKVDIEDDRNADVGSGRRFVAATDVAMIVEHMDVFASDGTKVGTVDHLDGTGRIKLAKSTSPDGQHHYVPLVWVDHVDQHVHLNKATAPVKAGW